MAALDFLISRGGGSNEDAESGRVQVDIPESIELDLNRESRCLIDEVSESIVDVEEALGRRAEEVRISGIESTRSGMGLRPELRRSGVTDTFFVFPASSDIVILGALHVEAMFCLEDK